MALLTCTTSSGPGHLDVGDQVARRSYVTDINGVPTDTTMTWFLTTPDGTPLTGNPAHVAVGQYLTTFPAFTLDGVYRWKIQATGTINQVEQGRFTVSKSLI